MTRFSGLFLALLVAVLPLRASDLIDASAGGASAKVTQPHVVAELIPETTLITAGKPFDVILHLKMDEGWHTYWINPGDAGLATTIRWTLPEGFTAGPIQWPTPENHTMGPLITYGYEGDVYLITTITPPAQVASGVTPVEIKARADWLVCQEECIPGKGLFSITASLAGAGTTLDFKHFENTALFQAARARLPVDNTRWDVEGHYAAGPGLVSESLWTQFKNKAGASDGVLGHLYFFPEQANVLSATQDKVTQPPSDQKVTDFQLILPLQQNGEKPAQVSGVLISDQPLIGNAKAIYIPAFSTAAQTVPVNSAQATPSGQPVAAAVPSGGSASVSGGSATAPPLGTAAATSEAASTSQPLLIAVLGAAFVGGLILNLMPCVLPVLSLKVFSLIKHAGEDPRSAWKQGAAFTAGVVLSFWILAGLLLVLKALGNQFGWGFQMQSPGFILAMIFLFFLLSLNLFGVFEMGTSLVGLDAKTAGKMHGLTSSFLNGALATIAATPCTGPLMGSTLGFAAQQPALIAMLVFTVLALGMASPYLLLTIFPGALRFVPKPGAWMEAFKQFMGFLLMIAVIWFVAVFGASVGEDRIAWLLLALLLVAIAAWIYGRWITYDRTPAQKFFPFIVLLFFLGAGVKLGVALAVEPVEVKVAGGADQPDAQGWRVWSDVAVDQALTDGKPVFVDFTAAWCLSCKVNERVALDTDVVRKAFTDKNVVLLKGDWTHSDPDISKALQKYNRDGVPLYLLYSPKDKANPQVLPEVLTPGIVLDALGKI